jgi:hypothetical protein
MKTKAILFIGAAALVTLSFTFVKTGKTNTNKIEPKSEQGAPVGGFAAEEILK